MGKYKHGLSNTRIHALWRKMIDRCNNPLASNYHNYGGRGIKICPEWQEDFTNFYNWAINEGYCDDLSLERINVYGNYEPQNCKWIEQQKQARNKRDTRYEVIDGERKPLIEWAELHGISYKTIMTRWYRGWRGQDLLQVSKKPKKVS